MHVITVIDRGMKERIDHIMSLAGSYRSMDEFVTRAVLNQIALEESGLTESVRYAREDDSMSKGKSSLGIAVEPSVGSVSPQSRKPPSRIRLQQPVELEPQLLSVASNAPKMVDFRPLDSDENSRPLWGQMNRLAPMKLPLRFLSNMLSKDGEMWIDIEIVSAAVSKQAPTIRAILEAKDEEEKRKRRGGFSAAFPIRERSSLQRFSNQYLGYLAKESGKAKGLLAELSLIDIEKSAEGTVQVGITEPGWEYTQIRSPLLDDLIIQGGSVPMPMSREEVVFLVDHMRRFRPGELNFLQSVVSAVSKGSNSPTALFTSVEEYFRTNVVWPNLTQAVVGTMRAGAVSKLVEMGVLGINKIGARSEYYVIEDGRALVT